MKFNSIKITDWEQFGTVDIEFHDRLTVLTGANATGKTTILNTLSRYFDWDTQAEPSDLVCVDYEQNASLVVLIDDIETRLHPAIQRTLLPDLLADSPKAQFIVSTHSPLMINSVRDSSVYLLKHNDRHKVDSVRVCSTNKAKGANDILRDVMGVPFTMPVWVEEKLNAITGKYSKLDIDEDTFPAMRSELAEIGLEDLLPESIHAILSAQNGA